MIDLWCSVKFLLIRFRRFSKTISSNPKYVLCSDWQLSYLQNELRSKEESVHLWKKTYIALVSLIPKTVSRLIPSCNRNLSLQERVPTSERRLFCRLRLNWNTFIRLLYEIKTRRAFNLLRVYVWFFAFITLKNDPFLEFLFRFYVWLEFFLATICIFDNNVINSELCSWSWY